LPKELIAQVPLKDRDKARLMVIERGSGKISEAEDFRGVAGYIGKGDCLVLNDTRVIPARLFGRKETGGKVEIFLLGTGAGTCRALIRPSKRVRTGEKIELENGVCAKVLFDDPVPEKTQSEANEDPGRPVVFDAPMSKVLENGHVPLPPYITRPDTVDDKEDYQTVFSRNDGATAAPTAGLHFTGSLISELIDRGVSVVYITLHTSYGSFAPVKVEDVGQHRMHSESFRMDEEAAGAINRTKKSGGRVFAVGTTSTRALETSAGEDGKVSAMEGETDLFIYPGYDFKVVDGMVTNFHLPGSTLLMLVCAFAGKVLVMKAYRKAIDSGFRFFSYGDAMIIL